MTQDENTSDAPSDVVETAGKLCPICNHAMREHTIDHSSRNTVVNCPVSHPGAWDRDAFEPVNEFGMVVHKTQ